MQTITKKFNLYTLRELKQHNKILYIRECEKIRDDLISARSMFLEEEMLDILATKYNLTDVSVHYSLSYSQGDGACFCKNKYNLLDYKRNDELGKLNAFEEYVVHNYPFDIVYIKDYLENGGFIRLVKKSNHYQHARTVYIDASYYENENESIERYVNDLIKRITDDLYENVYIKICAELEKYGYLIYDVDDVELLEYADANNYCFEEEVLNYE